MVFLVLCDFATLIHRHFINFDKMVKELLHDTQLDSQRRQILPN